jgi:hypothetical protein
LSTAAAAGQHDLAGRLHHDAEEQLAVGAGRDVADREPVIAERGIELAGRRELRDHARVVRARVGPRRDLSGGVDVALRVEGDAKEVIVTGRRI